MKRNPERIAWAVLLASFAIFCLIVVGVPLGVRWYIRHAEREHKALVESLSGTIVVEPPVGRGPIPLSKGQETSISEGTVIRTDETSEAVLTLFDHSFMRIFPDTSVRLERTRSPRYKSGQVPNTVHLYLLGGRIRVDTALSSNTELVFWVKTLHAQTRLAADGSYVLEATNDRSELTVYRGKAEVSAAGKTVSLTARQRTEIAYGQPPKAPVSAARNLIVNGDFSKPLSEGWRVFNDQGTDGGTVDGEATLVVDEGRRAVKFFRSGGNGNHCETILEQKINQKIPDPATSLVVRAMVKVHYQSLAGGGYLSSEYPLMIRLTYRDVYDSEAEWVQGFYYQNVSGNPTTYGLQIPKDRWFLFESKNLLETLSVRPYKIIKIRVYASGWDYESFVSDVSLIVE
ncbi:MAG: FecR domain-containing protein [Anaerolineae bacterium]|nr:FecR domain-containing protein [Anaerolineae bacterium]